MKWLLSNNTLLLLWASLMASSFVISADLLPYANPITSTGLRFIMASLFMIPVIVFSSQIKTNKQFSSTKVISQYTLISLFLVLFFIGLFEALKTTTAIRTSVIYTLLPLTSIVFTYAVLKTKTPSLQLLGFVLGSIGAALVLYTFNKEKVDFLNWNIGDSIFVLACLSLSMHVVLVKKWGGNVSPLQGSFYIMALGSLMLLPLMILFGELKQVAWYEADFWRILIYLTVFTTIATFFLQQRLVQKVGPNKLLAMTYLIPILVMLPEADSLTAIPKIKDSIYGISITLLALYIISRKQKTNL